MLKKGDTFASNFDHTGKISCRVFLKAKRCLWKTEKYMKVASKLRLGVKISAMSPTPMMTSKQGMNISLLDEIFLCQSEKIGARSRTAKRRTSVEMMTTVAMINSKGIRGVALLRTKANIK